MCHIVLICGIFLLLAVIAAVLGYIQDSDFLRRCDLQKGKILKAHIAFEILVFSSTLIVASCGAKILYSLQSKWQKIPECQNKWDGKEDVGEFTYCKFYRLYNDYIKIGKELNSAS